VRLSHLGLVMESESDRIEHVQEISLLPLPVLGEIHAQGGKAVSDRGRRLRLRGPAVSDESFADGLRRVRGDRHVAPSPEAPNGTGEPVHGIEPVDRMAMRRFEDQRIRMVGGHPSFHLRSGFPDPVLGLELTQLAYTAGDELLAPQDREPEVSESGIKGEDRCPVVVHGV